MPALLFPFTFGILAFLSPCILPMLQVYLALITGSTLPELSAQSGDAAVRRRIVIRTLLFVGGFSAVFVLAGLFAGTIGTFLRERVSVLNVVGGLFLIVFGLLQLGAVRFNLLRRLHLDPARILGKRRGRGAAFLVGVIFGVACSHCFGPLLYSTLLVAAATQSSLQGAAILLAFAVGLAVPYLLTALAMPAVLGFLRRYRRVGRVVMVASGAFLVLFGVLVVLQRFPLLATVTSRIIPWGDTLMQFKNSP